MNQYAQNSAKEAKHLVIVGAGGNIGSHLIPHLARLPNVSRITCIDRDVYEEKNIFSQDILPRDVGKSKAAVQARRAQQINPALALRFIKNSIENVPLGQLRGDLMLSCLDSKHARSFAHQFAWRRGMPFIDAGVASDGLLARVNVYVPGDETACMECGWNQDDYAAIEESYPCAFGKTDSSERSFSTNAPSSLGAFAAALQAIETQKILTRQYEYAAIGREVVVNALNHRHYVTEIHRRADCRFDHEIWQVEKLSRHPKAISIAEAFDLPKNQAACEPVRFAVDGARFATKVTCLQCGRNRKLLRLQNRLRRQLQTCACGGVMVVTDRLEFIERGNVQSNVTDRSLASIGLRPNDIFTLSSLRASSHWELEN